MIFYFLAALAIAFSVYMALIPDEWWYKVLSFLGFLAFSSLVGVLLSVFVNLVADDMCSAKIVRHVVRPIVSLKTRETIQGSFVLGCGGIGSSECYYFTYDLGNGRYQRDSEAVYETIIQESNEEKPNFSYDIYVNDGAKVDLWWPRPLRFTFSRRVENRVLTVPKGTVIQKFEVN